MGGSPTMTRSRAVLAGSLLLVSAGILSALGALALGTARAAVGPLPADALVLPAGTRFVVGLDVKRFVSSPFYKRHAATRPERRLEALRDLEEKTGLVPERDLDQLFLAGGATAEDAVALAQGRFDATRISRSLEQRQGVTWKKVQGLTVYLFGETSPRGAGALAFLDDRLVALGPARAVEAVAEARGRGASPLSSNQALLALVGGIKPGTTFWMAGDQSLLAQAPGSLPVPGAPGAGTGSIPLPALKGLVVTGDLDPLLSLDVVGEASDEAAARNLADVVRGLLAMASLQAAQKPELKDLAAAFAVTSETTRVRVTARIPYPLLDALQPKPSAPPAEAPAAPAPRR